MGQYEQRGKTPQAVPHLWLWWAVATGIAGALVGALEASGFQFLATVFFTGLFIGTAQWLILRHYIPKSFWWIAVSTLGWFFGLMLMVSLDVVLDLIIQFLTRLGAWQVFWMNLVGEPVVLAILGAAQLPILWRAVRKAYWWLPVSALGGALQGASGSAVAYVIQPGVLSGTFVTALSYGSGWLTYGIVTGICLQWLLRHQFR
ncbi:hypothetical protein H6F88_17005 [Oculatella sp. FACHB-28]|uniref:hypothetical protein n=1 Tax=Oculatella sp. FACHB-28 TaxID=2692845 RepID=UPI00168555B3|nr:hypothetical protein [Oculatella sp. FACHB-28]MBD2057695.1 hypothetical protein [Oculatella sp. FACHB-28]